MTLLRLLLLIVIAAFSGCSSRSWDHVPSDAPIALENGVGKFFVATQRLGMQHGSGEGIIFVADDYYPHGTWVGKMFPGTILYAYAMYTFPAEDANPTFKPYSVHYRIVTDGYDPLEGRPIVAGKYFGTVYRLDDDWARELTPEEAAYLKVPSNISPQDYEGPRVGIHDALGLLRRFAVPEQTYRPKNLPPGVAEPLVTEERVQTPR